MHVKLFSNTYTLIEALLSVALILILMSLISPALKNSIEVAESQKCKMNIREISNFTIIFSDDHHGRFPGHSRQDMKNAKHNGRYHWKSVLNQLYYTDQDNSLERGIRYWKTPVKMGKSDPGEIHCQQHEANPKISYSRCYALNEAVLGGSIFNWKTNNTSPVGLHGQRANDDHSYNLGSDINLFQSPSTSFLLLELEAPRDSSVYRFPYNTYLIDHLNDSNIYPAHTALGGSFAFRHLHQSSLNASFIDGHIETLSYLDKINFTFRFYETDIERQ